MLLKPITMISYCSIFCEMQ